MTDLADLITVCVCTSPTSSDPSLATIRKTISSVEPHLGPADCRVLIGADGVRPEQRDLAAHYDVRLATMGCSTETLRLLAWGHQANVIRMLLDNVTTPLVLMMEHDTPLTEGVPIDWTACATTLLEAELHSVRFLHESHILDEHRHMLLDNEPILSRAGLIHQRTAQWSQRPHLARVDWYRDLIKTYFARSSRTMVEDCMHGVVLSAWREHGMRGWERFKLGIYADPEPTMQRSTHLDGRAGAPKYDMVFSYPGDNCPEGAPAPTLGRVFE